MRESLILTIVLILFLDTCENKKTMNMNKIHLIKTDKQNHYIIKTKGESDHQKRGRPQLQNKAKILPEGKHLRQL